MNPAVSSGGGVKTSVPSPTSRSFTRRWCTGMSINWKEAKTDIVSASFHKHQIVMACLHLVEVECEFKASAHAYGRAVFHRRIESDLLGGLNRFFS